MKTLTPTAGDWYNIPLTRSDIREQEKILNFLYDEETRCHTDRVSIIAHTISSKMGFTPMQSNVLSYAASLHDIGKISIPAEIILKPGKLNDEEYEVVKRHPQQGYDMLANRDMGPVFDLAAIISVQHHERWDGSGYPYGLKGTEIICESQLISVCDVYEALSSTRTYKKSWAEKDIIQFFIDKRGTMFNPKIIDIFLDCSDDIKYNLKHKKLEDIQHDESN